MSHVEEDRKRIDEIGVHPDRSDYTEDQIHWLLSRLEKALDVVEAAKAHYERIHPDLRGVWGLSKVRDAVAEYEKEST